MHFATKATDISELQQDAFHTRTALPYKLCQMAFRYFSLMAAEPLGGFEVQQEFINVHRYIYLVVHSREKWNQESIHSLGRGSGDHSCR